MVIRVYNKPVLQFLSQEATEFSRLLRIYARVTTKHYVGYDGSKGYEGYRKTTFTTGEYQKWWV